MLVKLQFEPKDIFISHTPFPLNNRCMDLKGQRWKGLSHDIAEGQLYVRTCKIDVHTFVHSHTYLFIHVSTATKKSFNLFIHPLERKTAISPEGPPVEHTLSCVFKHVDIHS